ncbi:hypothetical protein Acid345_3171 [Candidatus Koribacter versatilis Ellin345]|uniref:Uncharacterized protein n=1 Tax=Koribacter versatilis (strain Ellin345) TaxID=204669 RepID=Q1ILS8_KORVE|nr:hypothetical protein [Candidatus Koribacter versatilis]ABF42172.1 hypothetical protein Acid345_3171 [Candidatus Koribacter versatilis Ellin345]
MALTSHPTHPVGGQAVRAKILADTVCQPHGRVERGQVVTVTADEYWLLRAAGKAELAVADIAPEVPEVQAEQLAEDPFVKLEAMTKPEICAFAKEQFGLELKERMPKDELIAAVAMATGKVSA